MVNHQVPSAQLVPLGHLDGRQQIGHPRYPQQVKALNDLRGHSLTGQIFPAGRFVEKADQSQGGGVIDGHHHVGVAHIMYPGNVLVSDPFYAVLPEAPVEHGGALQRLPGHDPAAGILLLQIVT